MEEKTGKVKTIIAEDRNILEDNENRILENNEIVGACQ